MSKSIEKDRRSVKRLRPEEIETVIIDTVFEDLQKHGFRAVTVESISAKTGIAKTSIYRRWPLPESTARRDQEQALELHECSSLQGRLFV